MKINKKESVFNTKAFEGRYEKIREKYGDKAVKEAEYEDDVKDLEETDKDTGPEYVIAKEKNKLKEAGERRVKVEEYVSETFSHPSYRANLAEYGMWLLMQKDLPSKFDYHCIPTSANIISIYGKSFKTQDGILFVLKAPDGRVFAKAMFCSYQPEVDVKAVGVLAVEVENTVDSLKGLLLSDKIK